MADPMANVQTRIVDRRQILPDEPDGINRPANGRVATETEEDTSMDIYICHEEQQHCKLMTVRQNKLSKTGKIYIKSIHMTNPSDFRSGDELVKVGNELLADTTKQTIQNYFDFDAEANGRLTKTVTISRTEDGKTDEIDVRVVFFINIEGRQVQRQTINKVEKKEDAKTIRLTEDGKTEEIYVIRPEHACITHAKPRRRTIDKVEKKDVEIEKVFIQTKHQTKYLKVRDDAAVVGDWLDTQDMDKFRFHLEAFNAFCRSPSGPVICCKIKCNKFWLKAKHTVNEGIELELTEEDTDDHTNLFIRKKNGLDDTWFESLPHKNAILEYDSKSNKMVLNDRTSPETETLQALPNASHFTIIPYITC